MKSPIASCLVSLLFIQLSGLLDNKKDTVLRPVDNANTGCYRPAFAANVEQKVRANRGGRK